MMELRILLFLILPLLFAGLSFVLVIKLKLFEFLKIPLDFGLKINAKRVFGDNKTFLGLTIMPLATLFWGTIINLLLQYPINNFWLFLLPGFFYVLGELPNSFIKRRLNIAPGRVANTTGLRTLFWWIDKYDSLVAVGICYILFFNAPVIVSLVAFVIGGGIHALVDLLMHRMGLK